jgi:uncharacterized phage protein (TIGR02220 family)
VIVVARPTKEGLEYFPLDTDIDQDEKVVVVVAKYGMRGFGILIRLMMEIYRKGYCCYWTEKEQYIFAMKLNEDAAYVNDVVQELIKWGFFDEVMFQQYGILTSEGFQKRYLLAVTRRKDIVIPPEHFLIKNINANNNPEIVDINPEIANENYTKEKKLKESKRKKDMSVYEEILSYLNKKTGKNFSHKSEANRKLINGRMSEGRTIENFKHVIDVKCEKWLNDEKMFEYLRPVTLFGQKNFENYVNEKLKSNQQQPKDARDKDIEFQKWLANGGDPAEFNWE